MNDKYINKDIQQDVDVKRLAETQKQNRNASNNANTIKMAADAASKSVNPYVKAAGGAVKLADKVSGGKVSEKLGKTVNPLNKFSPNSRLSKNNVNPPGNDSTSDRIKKATSKKGAGLFSGLSLFNSKNNNSEMPTNNLSNEEVRESASDGGGMNFKFTLKVIKITMIAFIPIFVVVIFMNLFVSASQTYLNVIGFGQADKISSEEADKKIRENGSEGLDNEITDEDDVGYVYPSDVFVENNNYTNKKLNNLNFIANEKNRQYNEANLEELEDYYSDINSYKDQGYDMDTVYKFFYKLLYIERHYRDYNIKLDMPLIMSILSIQTENKSEIFISNTKDYKVYYGCVEEDESSNQKKCDPKDNPVFDLDYDWSYYTPSKNNSAHDIEVLAQNMVKKTSDSGCFVNGVNGPCYKLVDDKEYREFLKEFLEKKYFINQFNNGSGVSCESIFTKYALTEEQLRQLASQIAQEQFTPKGAAVEASLMANRFEYEGSKYGEGADGLYNYVKESGWFANSVNNMEREDASKEIVEVVRKVLVEGKRTIPAYVTEHDCIDCGSYGFDVEKIVTNGVSITDSSGLLNRDNYVKYDTKIYNKYGGSYIFYTFPDTYSDPFGYIDESIRKEKGEFFYDYDSWSPQNCTVSGSGTLSFSESYSNGTATMAGGIDLGYEPDPSTAINYWSYVDSKNFVYPKDKASGKSLGAWPKNYQTIPTQLNNVKTYQGAYIWPLTPASGIYTFVYQHNGMDIMATFGSPIYSPVDGDLVYSTWGNTVNTGSDETAYSVTITPDVKVKYGGITIDMIYFTHMSGIVYRCEWGQCNRKVKKGELIGFVGNAAGNATSLGWAPHLHLSYYNSVGYYTGLKTTVIQKFYGIKSNTKIVAGG